MSSSSPPSSSLQRDHYNTIHDDYDAHYGDESSLELRSAERVFEGASVTYGGGPAYFLICNSFVLRVPKRLKPVIDGPLLSLERVFNALPGKAPFPFFVARWRRRPVSAGASR